MYSLGWVAIGFTYDSVSRLVKFSTINPNSSVFMRLLFQNLLEVFPIVLHVEMLGTKYYNHAYSALIICI